MKTAALYIRVSTKEQHSDNQLIALQEYAKRRGFQETMVYTDEGISGGDRRRPALNGLMDDARKRRFDVVLVARFDRFARSTQHLLSALDEFRALGIDFISLGESIDTTTPMGTMVFTIIAALGQFERAIIKERIHMGLARARKEGKQLGRPKGIVDRERALKLYKQHQSYRYVAERMGISKNMAYRRVQEARRALSDLRNGGTMRLVPKSPTFD